MALAKHNRLPAKSFQGALRRGRTVKDSFFFFKVSPTRFPMLRVGISIPARQAPRAIDRTRIRRSVLRAIEPIVKRTTLGYDIVVVIGKLPPKDPTAMATLKEAFEKTIASLTVR